MVCLTPRDEINRLFQLDYGFVLEFLTRILAVFLGSWIISQYMDWNGAWAWTCLFTLCHLSYFTFLKTRKAKVARWEVCTAHIMSSCVTSAYIWMPTYLMQQEDRVLILAGGAMLGSLMAFLMRGTDKPTPVFIIEVVLVSLSVTIIMWGSLLQVDSMLAKIGVTAAGLFLIIYFAQSMFIGRDLQNQARESAARLHQERKMAAIGRLAGGVAHDFNNNLTAIMGNLELIGLMDDPLERQECLNNAKIAARQAGDTVKHLMAYARKEPMNLSEQCVELVIQELTALTKRLVPASVELDIATDHGDALVMADKSRLLTALINLMVNAVDAMPDGGRLSLNTRVSTHANDMILADGSNLKAGRYIKISITDTGHGMPPDVIERALEPFFTTKPVGKGSGLGLSMALGVSKELGGGLSLASAHTGTQITMLLPQAAASTHDTPTPQSPADTNMPPSKGTPPAAISFADRHFSDRA